MNLIRANLIANFYVMNCEAYFNKTQKSIDSNGNKNQHLILRSKLHLLIWVPPTSGFKSTASCVFYSTSLISEFSNTRLATISTSNTAMLDLW